MIVTFILENILIVVAPYIKWYLDLEWEAGVSLFSEYSIIIAMRWIIIIVFQLPLLIAVFHLNITCINLVLDGMRKLNEMANRQTYGQNNHRAADGTFIATTSRPPGRPRKRNNRQ